MTIVRWLLWLSLWLELLEEQPLTGMPLEEATVKTKNANESLDDYAKTISGKSCSNKKISLLVYQNYR
jgi:hypothetical protein